MSSSSRNRYAADPVSKLGAWLSRPRGKAVECAWIFAFAACSAYGLRAFVVEARFIPSHSMMPGMQVGDRLLVEKVSARFTRPKRGEIVVFAPPPRARAIKHALIKRVIGVPGDRLMLRQGRVWLNGQASREGYVAANIDYAEPDWDDLGMPGGVVPKGMLFMMGDNRNDSTDSHVFGPVPIANVVGHPIVRFWPLSRLAWVRR